MPKRSRAGHEGLYCKRFDKLTARGLNASLTQQQRPRSGADASPAHPCVKKGSCASLPSTSMDASSSAPISSAPALQLAAALAAADEELMGADELASMLVDGSEAQLPFFTQG